MKWSTTKFESLYAAPSRNGLYKAKEFHGSGIRIVNMGEMFAFPFIGNQEMKLLSVTDEELGRFGLQAGDLLFARRSLVEEGAGKCSLIVDHDEPMVFESSMIRVRLRKECCDPQFYYYYFKSPIGRSTITAIVTGVAQKGIRGSELATIAVHNPPIPTQQRIADILFNYDRLIDNNTRRIALLEESIHRLYKEWFVRLRFPGCDQVKVVDGMPEGWTCKPLEEVCELIMGQSPRSTTYNTTGQGLPFHQGVTKFGNRFISHETYCTQPNRLAETGDILCSVRAPVGRLNITLDRIIIGRGLAAIRNRQGYQSFQFYQLKAYFFQEDLIGGGAIFASVTKKQLSEQMMLVPSQEVLQAFENISKPVDQQLINLYFQNKKLRQARDLLLPRLMNGSIVV
ncbi:restriction modification system DNA specificity domain protein (plasmid) [Crinalium epipsammum PCC 9333]|uniref:Restriction modification system DNA specificity domain protein n=1 Tax=Crinalium epipsammum PCC 9333 TaxID=1173022 RepID=K9W5I1_9CYAN|nr:restriction endonuclease subunit S [Crinalium epipsammum]AFZ15593.1 restriction modification system DNA specificity domain protein [Crinalium epipsammum PCC 9333]